MVNWYYYSHFRKVHGHYEFFGHFGIFFIFGLLYQEKSGNPDGDQM
jgi:hypothetical protein